MISKRYGHTFVPEVPPRTDMDRITGAPNLLLGWWQDDTGRHVEASVLTVPTYRRPDDIAEALTPTSLGVAVSDAAKPFSEVDP